MSKIREYPLRTESDGLFFVELKPVCPQNMATTPYQASKFCPTKGSIFHIGHPLKPALLNFDTNGMSPRKIDS